MFYSKLIDIINNTRCDETERKYGYDEIAVDLHIELDFDELDSELNNIF